MSMVYKPPSDAITSYVGTSLYNGGGAGFQSSSLTYHSTTSSQSSGSGHPRYSGSGKAAAHPKLPAHPNIHTISIKNNPAVEYQPF